MCFHYVCFGGIDMVQTVWPSCRKSSLLWCSVQVRYFHAVTPAPLMVWELLPGCVCICLAAGAALASACVHIFSGALECISFIDHPPSLSKMYIQKLPWLKRGQDMKLSFYFRQLETCLGSCVLPGMLKTALLTMVVPADSSLAVTVVSCRFVHSWFLLP